MNTSTVLRQAQHTSSVTNAPQLRPFDNASTGSAYKLRASKHGAGKPSRKAQVRQAPEHLLKNNLMFFS